MKKIILIALFGVLLAGCSKDSSFDEYYECEKTYKATVTSLNSQYDNHKITATALQKGIENAEKTYEQCLINNGGK